MSTHADCFTHQYLMMIDSGFKGMAKGTEKVTYTLVIPYVTENLDQSF